jgi:H+/gluconate symporter-like permease
MSPEVLSIIGILLGLAILIVFALKGVPLYVLAPLAALVVAIFAGGNILTTMTDTYMTGFANFMKSYFLMFALSSIFAKIMSDSGAAKVIALKVARLVRLAPVKYQRLLAVLSVGIMTAILTVGGINLYCCVFVLVSIGKDLFEEFDVPWHLYMTSSLGSGSFTMSMIPGTPAIQNLIPMEVLGTEATAAPVLGIISTILCIVLSVIYCKYALTKCDKKGEHFLPTGAKVKASSPAENSSEMPKINLIVCLIPSIALLVALNGFKLNAVVSLVVAVVVALILFGPSLVKSKASIANCFGDGIRNAIMVLLNVCVIVGFGSVVSSTAGYTAIMAALDKIPGPPIFQLFVAVNIAAGVAGSASSALGIGLGMFAEKFLAMGISPDIIHRISVMASGGLDTLPHSSGTASALGVAQLSHKEGYMHVFWLNTVIPIIVTAFACVLASLGVC